MARTAERNGTSRPTLRVGALSYRERLYLVRRRSGRTQAAEAIRLGLSTRRYHALESGLIKPGNEDPKAPAPRNLTDVERCIIIRRRAGMQVGALAMSMGVSRAWLQMLERGDAPIDRLRDFWVERQGG